MNSAGVRVATGGRVSHAILYTGAAKGFQFAVDAMPQQRVTKDRLYRKLLHVSDAVVFRHRTATPEQRARALLHKPYDSKSAARLSVPYTNVCKLNQRNSAVRTVERKSVRHDKS
jgi:hypothetical protein